MFSANTIRWSPATIGLVLASQLGAQSAHADEDIADAEGLPPAIHATRLDYSEYEVPEAVTVITQEDIVRAGYLEVSEIFRSIPGFRIVKIGDESRLSYHGTTVRQNRRMKITIDGRSALIGDGQYVEFDRLPIDLEDIARVTVTRGPNGAAYGDNAFLASIDFQTIGPNDPRGTGIRVGGGYNDRRKFGVVVNEELAGFRVAFSAGTERDGGYDFSDDMGTPRNDGKEIDRARLNLEREFNPGSRWILDASAYDSEHKIGIRALGLDGEQTNEGQFIAMSNKREIGDSSRLDWFISHNQQEELIRNQGCYTPEAIAAFVALVPDPADQAGLLAPTLFLPGVLGVPLQDVCFFLDLGIESDRTEFEIEYESRRGPIRYLVGGSASWIDASSSQWFAGMDQDQRTYRAFAETAYSMEPFHFSLGFMAQDSDNVADTQYAYRAAVNWQFSEGQMLRYSFADSFRIPSLVETETFWTTSVTFGRRSDPLSAYAISFPLPLITSATEVKPETIESHAIGYYGRFLNSRVELDVKIFEERIEDPVEANFFYFTATPFNSAAYKIRGAEAEFRYRPSERWLFSGQYSNLDNTAPADGFERSLHGDDAGSLAATYTFTPTQAITGSYYGNSVISGNSYDRYDLVYTFNRNFGETNFRAQLIFQHYAGGGDGIDREFPFLPDEGFFDNNNQFYLFLGLTW